MAFSLLKRINASGLVKILRVLFVIAKRSESRAWWTRKAFFFCSKLAISLDIRPRKRGLWHFKRAWTQQLEFTYFSTAQDLMFSLVYGVLWDKLLLCTHGIIAPAVKLRLEVNKIFIAEIKVSMQHITSLDDDMDIHPGVHSRKSNNFLNKRDGK